MSNKLFDLVTVLKSFLGRSEDEIKNYIKSPEKLNRNGAELATNHVALALSRSKLCRVKKVQILSGLMNCDLSTREVRLILEDVERVYKKMKGDEREFYRLKTIQLPCRTHLSVPARSPNDHLKRYPVRSRTPRPVMGETDAIVLNLQKQLKIERAKVSWLKRKVTEKRVAGFTFEANNSTDSQYLQQTEAAKKSLADLQRKYNSFLRDFQFFKEEVENAQHLTVEDVNKVTSCPQIPVRGSLRDINPKLVSVLVQLRNTHKVPLSGCLEVFLCVANGFFGHSYNHGNSTVKTQDILPKPARAAELVAVAGDKRKRDCNTLPSKAFVKSQNETIHLPLALKSNAETVKASDYSTVEIAGCSSQMEQVDHIKLEQLEGITFDQLEDIKLEQLEGITLDQLEDIKLEQLEGITLEQLEDIKLEQVEGITLEQLEEIKLEKEENIKMEDTTQPVPADTAIKLETFRCGACGEYFFYEKYFLEHVQEHVQEHHQTPNEAESGAVQVVANAQM